MSMPLRFVALPGINPPPNMKSYYEATYAHWELVWGQTFKELEGKDKIFSDNFTRQDEVFALFEGELCVAMVCHRYVDLSTVPGRKDSYFEAWPELAMKGLTAHGPRIFLANQISVHPEKRGRSHGVSLKDLLSSFTVWHMRQLDVDAMTGTMRADKNMQNVLYDCGAIPLMKNVIFHNVPVDLLAFHPQVRPVTIQPDIEKMIETLWANRAGEAPLDYLKTRLREKKAA